MIIEQVMKYPGEVTLVCTAPLTNLALAIMLKPEIVPLIKKVYHLGGSYGFSDAAFLCATGDTPMSEWNVYVDPEAADLVYSSGVNLTTVGLDIAYGGKTNISDDTLQKILMLNTPQSRYVGEILQYIEGATSDSNANFHFRGTIDTAAMCAFLCPKMIQTKKDPHIRRYLPRCNPRYDHLGQTPVDQTQPFQLGSFLHHRNRFRHRRRPLPADIL